MKMSSTVSQRPVFETPEVSSMHFQSVAGLLHRCLGPSTSFVIRNILKFDSLVRRRAELRNPVIGQCFPAKQRRLPRGWLLHTPMHTSAALPTQKRRSFRHVVPGV